MLQGDRGLQGERGMKGTKGDMGDPGVPGDAVSKHFYSSLPQINIHNFTNVLSKMRNKSLLDSILYLS